MRQISAMYRLAVASSCLVIFSSSAVQANSIRSVTLGDLYKQADAVLLVKIVAGDTEHYDSTVYKALVETKYKGTDPSQIIYFGPFDGYGVGSEYILFLKKGVGAKPKNVHGLSFGDVASVGEIMYAGYAALPVGYDCVFDDHAVQDSCDDSVQVNPGQVILPKSMSMFPKGDADARTNYKKWVRKSSFLSQLERLTSASKGRKP